MITCTHSPARRPSWAPTLMLAAALTLGLQPSPAEAQQRPQIMLEASRHNLSHGRHDGLRIEGIAGVTLDRRAGKFYRNVPGLSGPGGLFDVIAGLPNPQRIFFDPPDGESGGAALIEAGRWVPAGFTLVVIERGPERFAYNPEAFMRFGEGNFYATVAIPGTDIVPGMELYTRAHFDAYAANSILWEAPDIGNVVVDTALAGGTVNLGAILLRPSPAIGAVILDGRPYSRHLGYANPLQASIGVESKRELPDGRCRVQLRAAVSATFGNPVAGAPPDAYSWFRWAFEDRTETRMFDVAGTDRITVDFPAEPGDPQPGMISATVVAASFGPDLMRLQGSSVWPLVTLGTNPFIQPLGDSVGLGTFHSYAGTLGDTETFVITDCDPQPLEVMKQADAASVPADGGEVTYRVTVFNTSRTDPVTVTQVADDLLGDLSDRCMPALPVDLRPGGRVDCRITTEVAGAPETTVTNIATATGHYTDDRTPVAAQASASVQIERDEDDDDAERTAECNSAVQAGGDAGGGVTVDLGDFEGKAGFTWEMYRIKDRMDVTVGGVTLTTGCVSGSGTFEIDVPREARTARVEVIPNCEGTRGTAWRFEFECPLRSAVTADGTGAPLDAVADADGRPGTPPGGPGWGAPVAPAPAVPPVLGPTGRQVAESAPNDSPDTATRIGVGDTVTGRISSRGDVDFYSFDLPAAGELSIDFTAVPAGVTLTFRVLDAQGRQVHGWQRTPSAGRPFSTFVDIARPGRYLLEVRDHNNRAWSSDAYVFVTVLRPTADPAEPNDSMETATPLGWNRAVAANILPRGDVDFYAVTAPRPGQMTVSFREAPPSVTLTFRVLDARGQQVWGWQRAPRAGTTFTAFADLPAAGRYYIEVRDHNNAARDAVPYRLVAAFDAIRDPADANDTLETATPIALDRRIEANILPRGDVDFYRVDLPRPGQMTVDFPVAPPTVTLTFRVLDAAGNQVEGWQRAPAEGQTFASFVDIPAPGAHVIEVRDHNNAARSARPYAMVVSHIPTADPAEPNDSLETATPLQWDRAVEANILPRGDVDFYAVTAHRAGQLTVGFPQTPPSVTMTFRVLDAQGQQVRGWQRASKPGAGFTAYADLDAPGRYFLEVRDHNNAARDAVPYRLVASFVETHDPAEPNDSRETATPIGLDRLVQANILPRGDVDHYRVDLPRQGQLTVDFPASPPTVTLTFRVLDPAGNQVAGWQRAPAQGLPFATHVDIPAPGAYILEVRDHNNAARSAEPYAMVVSLVPTVDPAEPNDTIETATPIAPGQRVQANILPRGDVDHYRVSAPREATLWVTFHASPPEVRLTFRVLTPAGQQVAGWQTAPREGARFAGPAALPAAGDYVVEIRDHNNAARSVVPYAFSVTFE